MTDGNKNTMLRLQNDALDVLSELSEIFPDNYRMTLVARDCSGDGDIVLTNDVIDDAIRALEKNKAKMESAS